MAHLPPRPHPHVACCLPQPFRARAHFPCGNCVHVLFLDFQFRMTTVFCGPLLPCVEMATVVCEGPFLCSLHLNCVCNGCAQCSKMSREGFAFTHVGDIHRATESTTTARMVSPTVQFCILLPRVGELTRCFEGIGHTNVTSRLDIYR